jgi:hypothetical protein
MVTRLDGRFLGSTCRACGAGTATSRVAAVLVIEPKGRLLRWRLRQPDAGQEFASLASGVEASFSMAVETRGGRV